jgi:hypothetical protein
MSEKKKEKRAQIFALDTKILKNTSILPMKEKIQSTSSKVGVNNNNNNNNKIKL